MVRKGIPPDGRGGLGDAEGRGGSPSEEATPDGDTAPLSFVGVRAVVGDREPLHELTLTVSRGAIVALLGAADPDAALVPRLALGFVQPEGGRVLRCGRDLAGASRAERSALRQRVGVVWRGGALFDDEDVAGNVGFALRQVQGRPRAEVDWAVRESLLLVGLEHIEHLRVDELTDEVRLRVALARAVAHRPELLLLDEPARALDPVAAAAFRALVRQLRDRLGVAVLLITRDADWALPIADRVTVLREGRAVASGAPGALLAAGDPALQPLRAGPGSGRGPGPGRGPGGGAGPWPTGASGPDGRVEARDGASGQEPIEP